MSTQPSLSTAFVKKSPRRRSLPLGTRVPPGAGSVIGDDQVLPRSLETAPLIALGTTLWLRQSFPPQPPAVPGARSSLSHVRYRLCAASSASAGQCPNRWSDETLTG